MPAAPFAFQQLDHVVLRTADTARLVAFYCQLGCTPVRSLEDGGLHQLRAGASIIDILDVNGAIARGMSEEPPPAADAVAGRNMDHFALRVEPFDGDAIAAFCSANGIEFHQPDTPLLGADGFGPAIYLLDPDGNRVELKGRPLRPPPDA